MISFIETDDNEKIWGEKMLRLWYAKTYVQARWCQGRNQKGKSQSISEIPCVIPKSPSLFWYPLRYSEIACVIPKFPALFSFFYALLWITEIWVTYHTKVTETSTVAKINPTNISNLYGKIKTLLHISLCLFAFICIWIWNIFN